MVNHNSIIHHDSIGALCRGQAYRPFNHPLQLSLSDISVGAAYGANISVGAAYGAPISGWVGVTYDVNIWVGAAYDANI